MPFQVRQEVLAMCDLIDQHFIFAVGPFGEFVVEETREQWLASGKKVTAGHVLGYIQLLAAHIAEPSKRDKFLQRARDSLFRLPPG
jgi:hypothetical protein